MKTGKSKLLEIAESLQENSDGQILNMNHLTEIGYYMYELNKIIGLVRIEPGNKKILRAAIITMARLLEAVEEEESTQSEGES